MCIYLRVTILVWYINNDYHPTNGLSVSGHVYYRRNLNQQAILLVLRQVCGLWQPHKVMSCTDLTADSAAQMVSIKQVVALGNYAYVLGE